MSRFITNIINYVAGLAETKKCPQDLTFTKNCENKLSHVAKKVKKNMSKFSQEASIQSDLPSLPLWSRDSRHATDSPTLTVHQQNLQVSCKLQNNFLLKQHQFPLLLELSSILTTNWLCLKCWKCIFSQSQDTNFQNFQGEHASGPPTRGQKIFSHPCR